MSTVNIPEEVVEVPEILSAKDDIIKESTEKPEETKEIPLEAIKEITPEAEATREIVDDPVEIPEPEPAMDIRKPPSAELHPKAAEEVHTEPELNKTANPEEGLLPNTNDGQNKEINIKAGVFLVLNSDQILILIEFQ